MTTGPQIVLVHGAFHTPYHLQTLAALLRASPYDFTVRVPQLPSSSPKPPSQSFDADVATIKAAIEEAALEGGSCNVVPVFHSYASAPGFDAIASLKPEIRKQIKRVVLIAAFVLRKGTSLTTDTNGAVAPWAERKDNLMVVPDPIPTFYADVPAPLAERYAAHVVAQSYESASHPTQCEGWRNIPITYVLCKNDAAVVTEWIQRPAVALLQEHGLEFEVIELESSHSPFISQPERCAELVREGVR